MVGRVWPWRKLSGLEKVAEPFKALIFLFGMSFRETILVSAVGDPVCSLARIEV